MHTIDYSFSIESYIMNQSVLTFLPKILQMLTKLHMFTCRHLLTKALTWQAALS